MGFRRLDGDVSCQGAMIRPVACLPPAPAATSRILAGLPAPLAVPALLLVASCIALSCGPGGGSSGDGELVPGPGDASTEARGPGGGDAARVPDSAGPESRGGPYAPDGYLVAFGYRGMIDGYNTDQHELELVDRQGRNPLTGELNAPYGLTTFHLDPDECELVVSKNADGTPFETLPCSCAFGCVLDDSLDWMAVSVEKPGPGGHTFQVARFNDSLEAKVVKGVKFKNVADFHFAGHFLLYTTSLFCTSTGCQYALNRYDLDNIAKTPEVVAVIPPEQDPDWIEGDALFKGHFRPSADGRAVLALSPTIRSLRVYLWKGKDLTEVDYLCPGGFQGDHCTGTGSDFRDTDPAALDADGSRLAYVAVVGSRLELRLPDPDGGPVQVLALQAVEEGKDYTSNICKQVLESDWRFEGVSQLAFRDPDTLLLIGRSDCSPEQEKPWTDLWSLSLPELSGLDLLGEGDLERLVRNPRNDGVGNTVLDAFDLSPDGTEIIYTATPRFGADLETELPSSSPNAMQSGEVWRLSPGQEPRQITYDPEFTATSPKTLPLEALKGLAP